MMMKEDFSLASMEQQFQAAGGGTRLTEDEAGQVRSHFKKVTKAAEDLDRHLRAAKTRMERETAKLKERTAAGDLDPKPRRHVVLDEEGLRLKAEYERAKQDFQRAVFDRRMASRGWVEKALDTFVKWRRAFLLSSPVTLAKLSAAAVLRMGITPLEEGVGAVLGKYPVFPRWPRKPHARAA